jgi:hypothetical protein
MIQSCGGGREHNAAMMCGTAVTFVKVVLYICGRHLQLRVFTCGDGWKVTPWLLAPYARPLDANKSLVCGEKNIRQPRATHCCASQQGAAAIAAQNAT